MEETASLSQLSPKLKRASMKMQPNMSTTLNPTIPIPLNFAFKPSSRTSIVLNPKATFLASSLSSTHKVNRKISASSFNPVISDENTDIDFGTGTPSRKKKFGVVVKPLLKPRLVLKFIWMKKDIGISLDQMISGYGTIPLSPYYFWPRKDAWEELKLLLESKEWISEMQRIQLLNQATDIINLWQESSGSFS